MKRLLLCTILPLCALIAMAQVPTIYDTNFALTAQGASATATSGNAAQAIDGNSNSRWESEHGVDPQVWTLDMGQLRLFSRIQIEWEGAYAKTYSLEYSDNNETWTPLMEVSDGIRGNHVKETLNFDPVTARYIRFTGTQRATVYGYSFYEFGVLLPGGSVLTTFQLSTAAPVCPLSKSVALSLSALDQNDTEMDPGEVVYTVSPADAGTVHDGVYQPAKKGPATITATAGSKSSSAEVFAYDATTNLCQGKTTTASYGDASKAVDKNTETMWIGSANTADSEAGRTYDCWFTVDLGAQYDIEMLTLRFEGACSQEYHVDFSVNSTDWTTGYTYSGKAGIDGRTDYLYAPALTATEGVRYVRFYSTKAATQYGVKVREIEAYGTLNASGEVEAAVWPQNAVLTPLAEQVRVLSLNNSLIDYNDQYVLFNNIAAAMGKDATWTKHTNLGKTLDYHYDEDPLTPSALDLIATTEFTHIVLQEQSSRPLTEFAAFRASVIRWVQYIRQHGKNPSATIILPVNWAYNTETAEVYAANNAALMANYAAVAQELGLVLCPMAQAYQIAVDTDPAYKTSLYTDNRHPSQAASYMAAVAEYSVIFGVDATSISQKPAGLSEEVAAAMRTFAKAAIDATEQTIDPVQGLVRYQLRRVDAQGNSLGELDDATFATSGGSMSGNIFRSTLPGEYTITATRGTQQFTTTVYVGTAPEQQQPEKDGIALSSSAPLYEEDFDILGGTEITAQQIAAAEKTAYTKSSTLPEHWKIMGNTTAPTTIPTYKKASEKGAETTYVGGTNMASNAKNGTWNLGKAGDSDRALGGVTTSASGGARCINVMTVIRNADTEPIQSLSISYDIEKYRKGSNSAGYTFALYYNTTDDSNVWTAAGADFVTTFAPDATTAGVPDAQLPIQTQSISGQLPVTIAPGEVLYLAWHYAVSSGDQCASAQVLALDNVSIKANYSKPVPTTMEQAEAAEASTKVLIDGSLYIIRDHATYDLTGRRIR